MWFLSKIKYGIQDSLGKWKAISEQFLHDAISYGDVEAQLTEFLKDRVKDYEHDISKVRYYSVYEPHVKGAFYKVQYEEKTTTKAGVEKITVKSHLVIALDVPDAERRAKEYMKNWVTDTKIIGADKTKILGVWHPHNQQWKDDFTERMIALAEAGHESPEPAPTTLFNADGTAKKVAFGDEADQLLKEHDDAKKEADEDPVKTLENAFGPAKVGENDADQEGKGVSKPVKQKSSQSKKKITFLDEQGDPTNN
ncbi:DUF4494 family protein [Spirosoma sp.]|uniref:DUF4494 family protein n=1 Tax=Spirosoma sp. TaxID=1899569 RepID=UPI002616ADA8|nr:DUF4494 family protein [Spirosoma sp.]MCX6218316.1 DUF4494 family protein [Spirosoma sp.]